MAPFDAPRAPRVPTAIVATVTAGKRASRFTILNVSVTGAKLEGPLAINKGERIKIKFVSEGRTLEVAAEVVRVDTADLLSDQIAARFVDVSPEAQATIQEIVDERIDLDDTDTISDDEQGTSEIVIEPED